MELEWEQGRQSTHTAAALAGAFLGAALGADCFLAAYRLTGEIPAVLCGAAMAFWAVNGGTLFAGRASRPGTVLALFPVILWSSFANHLSSALAAAPGDPAGIRDALLSMEIVGNRYWLRLIGVLGTAFCTWGLLYIQPARGWELEKRASGPCRNPPQPPPVGMEVFLPSQAWIRPWLLQRRITQGLWLAVLFLCTWIPALLGHERAWDFALTGICFSLLAILSLPGPSGRILSARNVLYVRREGQLWRVPANRIQYADLWVPLSRLIPMWDRLPGERKKSILSALAALTENGNPAAAAVKNPKLERQTPWEWVISSRAGVHHLIPKVYPNFSPVPGDTQALKEPVPIRWLNPAVTLLITALCLSAGFGLGLQKEHRAALLPPEPPPVESVVPDPEDSTHVTQAIAPKVIGDYYLNGLILRTDDAFQASTTRLEDQKNGLTYRISLQYGVGEEAARISLERTQGENARCLRPDSEEFLWGMGDNGVTYRYNLRTVQLPHHQTAHTGAALSERGTLIVIECIHDNDTGEELARGTLLYMLENLQFTGPAITEENYQEQLRPAIHMGFNYCGQAFFKAPEGMFEYDVFLDTFMPCGGKVNYYDGGISMMTKAHGLRVSAAIVPSEGTAMDVVEQAYQDLKAAGRQYDEQTLFQDAYNGEGNNACRLTVYYDGGRTRVTVLVAMEEREGYYLFKEVTCLPEEVDSEYQAVFKEMETTCGIEVSVMEDLGRHSQ